jgi:hypothetical protein
MVNLLTLKFAGAPTTNHFSLKRLVAIVPLKKNPYQLEDMYVQMLFRWEACPRKIAKIKHGN